MKKKILIISISIILVIIFLWWLWLAKENGMCTDHDQCPFDQVCSESYMCEDIELWVATFITEQDIDELIKDYELFYISMHSGLARFSLITKDEYTTAESKEYPTKKYRDYREYLEEKAKRYIMKKSTFLKIRDRFDRYPLWWYIMW